jgi:hypothetical protein
MMNNLEIKATNYLKGLLLSKGVSRNTICSKLEISEATYYSRVNNPTTLSAKEIDNLAELTDENSADILQNILLLSNVKP